MKIFLSISLCIIALIAGLAIYDDILMHKNYDRLSKWEELLWQKYGKLDKEFNALSDKHSHHA